MPQLQPLVILGAGGFGREVAWLVEEINMQSPTFELIGFVDDSSVDTVERYPVLGTFDDWVSRAPTNVRVVCAVGDPASRYRMARRATAAALSFATLIHPTVRSSRWVEIGPGSIVTAYNILTTNIRIGAHSLLNLDCTVGHDCVLGEFASLMPGVHISGEVTFGPGVYLGTGAVVINGVSIGAWTTVGAGAVVSSDLPEKIVAVGVPAKQIKSNPHVPAGYVE
ncbi:MAG: acetyltransferase [Gemmatimonadaceae bacterium]